MRNPYENLTKCTARTPILRGLAALALGVYALGCGSIQHAKHPVRVYNPNASVNYQAQSDTIYTNPTDPIHDPNAVIPKDQANDYAIINGKLQLKPKRPYGIVTGEAVETTSASLDSVLYKTKPDSTK
ncbi:MAG TPA: hypothetical protein VJJ23_03430 [Candidatus Nanoarchaeia archaeon]|nr:hypothetical protein [Candidatus Nanoarchaeia archaeon]